jgi:glycosyltransferase involved in cell wall biosynthesis
MRFHQSAPKIEKPRISVVVPHYQDIENLDLCLTCLGQQTVDAGTVEIIVADNMSPIGLSAVEAVVHGRARVILATEKGAGPARNAGVMASTGDILAFTDSDCRPDPMFLEAGVAKLADADVVGGAIRVDVAVPGNPTPAEAFELVFAFKNNDYVEKKGFSVSAALITTRAVFQDVGPFANGVAEDLDWCRRATAKGYRLRYAERATIGHPARRDWPEIERKWRRLTSEGYETMRRERYGRLRWIARCGLVLLSVIPHALAIMMSPALSRNRDRLGALQILIRLRIMRVIWAVQMLAKP